MPTGYTEAIAKNPDISFEEFTLRCVRAMGVSIMMRDEPFDAPITRNSIAGIDSCQKYHSEALEKAKNELERINSVSPEDESFRNKVIQCVAESIAGEKEQIENKKRLRDAYANMLEKIKEWEPPTADHEGLKKFMMDQVEDSIKFDCDDTYNRKRLEQLEVPIDFDEEYAVRVKAAEDCIKYHSKYLTEDVDRGDSRIEWMEKLCQSIGVEFK